MCNILKVVNIEVRLPGGALVESEIKQPCDQLNF